MSGKTDEPVSSIDYWQRRGYVENKGQHEWVPSTLGHGERMCKHCYMTNREAAVLGMECPGTPSFPSHT